MSATYEDITITRDRVERCRRVTRVRFDIKTPQVWYDGWRGRDRIMRFTGTCVTCGRRCYEFDDGENDPRGALGDHADSSMSASDYNATGPDIVQCFNCANTYETYRQALEYDARRLWKDADGDPFRG